VKRLAPLRVLVVSPRRRWYQALAEALRHLPALRVLPQADTFETLRRLILSHHPDAIVLDLAWPADQLERLLDDLHEHYPVPLIACGDGRRDGPRAMLALGHGALEVITPPRRLLLTRWKRFAAELAARLRQAVACARPPQPPLPAPPDGVAWSFRRAGLDPRRCLIVIGASTGGPEALKELMAHMPADAPACVVVQHMPAMFTPSFAASLDRAGPLGFAEARDGQPLRPQMGVVARGDTHLEIRRYAQGGWYVKYTHQVKVNRHCPSVDVLFDSAVAACGAAAIGILLTGMGDDGARGLLRLRRAGALTAAQDAQSCVVFGMPRVAQELGAADIVAPPAEIPARIVQMLQHRRPSPALIT